MADKSVNIKITGNSDNAVAAVKKTSLSFTELNQGLELVKKAYSAVETVFKQSYALAQQGAKIEQTTDAYDYLTERYHIDSNSMISDLEKVTRKTIMDDDLMAAVNQTLNTGIVTGHQDIMDIMELSRIKAKQTGQDTLVVYNNLVGGIENMREATLRNNGVQVDTQKVYGDLATSLGYIDEKGQPVVTMLSDQEKQAALTKAVVASLSAENRELGDSALSAKDKFDQAKVKFDEVKDTVSIGVMNAFVGLSDYLNNPDSFASLDHIARSLESIGAGFNNVGKTGSDMIIAVSGYFNNALFPVVGGLLSGLDNILNTLESIIDVAEKAFDAVAKINPGKQLGNFLNDINPWASGNILNQRASGGPVSSGSPYIVGEKGPELFVPGKSGTIVSSDVFHKSVDSLFISHTNSNIMMATGGSFTVPSGYPNDSFRMGLSSGEEVTVDTPQNQRSSGGSGVSVGNVNIYNNMDWAIFKRQLAMELAIR